MKNDHNQLITTRKQLNTNYTNNLTVATTISRRNLLKTNDTLTLNSMQPCRSIGVHRWSSLFLPVGLKLNVFFSKCPEKGCCLLTDEKAN